MMFDRPRRRSRTANVGTVTRLQHAIARLGGLAATHELHAAGFPRAVLRLAVDSREIRRIRTGWYVLPDLPAVIADCARLGGRASCITLVEELGLWVHEHPREVHVAVRPNACQLRDPHDYLRRDPRNGAIVHWTDTRSDGSRLRAPLAQALLDLASCRGAEAAFVAAESALAAGLITIDEVQGIARTLPAALGFPLLRARGLSGSITEAAFVFRGSVFGVRIRQQVQIGTDRVDVLLGDRLIVELDSKEFHERERDYARDARLVARGYRVLRFSYRQVMFEWPQVMSAIRAAIARGDAS